MQRAQSRSASTHRESPHTYGVSFFSSKGPTGDGRLKPDLVAPGERITSCAAGKKLESFQSPKRSEVSDRRPTSMTAARAWLLLTFQVRSPHSCPFARIHRATRRHETHLPRQRNAARPRALFRRSRSRRSDARNPIGLGNHLGIDVATMKTIGGIPVFESRVRQERQVVRGGAALGVARARRRRARPI